MSKVEIPSLSDRETLQLGTKVPGSNFEYVSKMEYFEVREKLVDAAQKLNPLLENLQMTAYTPGETYALLANPIVRMWQREIVNFRIPKIYKKVIFVPCAKTKPWNEENSRRSDLYRSYHRILSLSKAGAVPPVYFVTLSEPLGIVPQDFWAEFPQYDNPVLFRDDILRTGWTTKEWKFQLGKKKVLPFDSKSYDMSVKILGCVVARFVANNKDGRKLYSFVGGLNGITTSHEDMLCNAIKQLGMDAPRIMRYAKRSAPRREPAEFILSSVFR